MTKEEVDDILSRTLMNMDWKGQTIFDHVLLDAKEFTIGYVWVIKDAVGKPLSLQRLSPYYLVPQPVEDDYPDGYYVYTDNRKPGLPKVKINPSEIIRIRRSDSSAYARVAECLLAM